MNGFLQWLKTAYSEPNGSGSSTRFHIGLILGFVLGLGIAFGTATLHKLYTIEQFNNFLVTSGEFFVTTVGPIYAANRLADWAKNRDDKNNQQPGA